MHKLLEDYLATVQLLSKPKVKEYNTGNTRITFTYTHEENETNHDLLQKLSLWDLVEFVYNKTVQ